MKRGPVVAHVRVPGGWRGDVAVIIVVFPTGGATATTAAWSS
jgi:hypothetical protein